MVGDAITTDTFSATGFVGAIAVLLIGWFFTFHFVEPPIVTSPMVIVQLSYYCRLNLANYIKSFKATGNA